MSWGFKSVLGGTLTPSPSFLAIELLVFAIFLLCLRHALRIGRGEDRRYERSWGPLCAMLLTTVFTFALEYRLGVAPSEDNIYSYPADSYLLYLFRVPVWIPIGWAFVVYLAMRTSDRLEPDWRVRPVLDALLALNLDAALDPVAEIAGWWRWKLSHKVFSLAQLQEISASEGVDCLRDAPLQVLEPAVPDMPGFAPAPQGDQWIPADWVQVECLPSNEPGYSDFFGIPLSNFFAWFVIVAGYSFSVRWIRRRKFFARRSGLGWELLAAALAVVPALGLVMGYKWISLRVVQADEWYLHGVLLFTVVWGLAVAFIARRWLRYPRDRPYDRLLWLAPLVLHLFFYVSYFVLKGHLRLPELALFLPSTGILGLYGYGWAQLDAMAERMRAGGWKELFRGERK